MPSWLSSLFARIARWLGRRQRKDVEEPSRKRTPSSFTMHGLEDRQHL